MIRRVVAADLPSGFWPHALPQQVSHDLVLQQMVSLQVSWWTAGPHLVHLCPGQLVLQQVESLQVNCLPAIQLQPVALQEGLFGLAALTAAGAAAGGINS